MAPLALARERSISLARPKSATLTPPPTRSRLESSSVAFARRAQVFPEWLCYALEFFGKHFAACIDGCPHYGFAFRRRAVAVRVRDLGDQPMCAQQLEQARNVRGPAAALAHVLGPRGEQHGLNVPVTEAIDMVLATQHGMKQLLLLPAEQIQAAPAAPARPRWALHSLQDLEAGLGPIHDRQGAEVTFVGGAGNFVIAVEVGDTLVHGAPDQLVAPLPLAATADLELARLVDDRLDAQHLAELVVHLQPVVLHPMFDPRPGPAVLLAVGQYLAVEARVQAAAQEGKDVLGGEVQAGMSEQLGV